jgi:hypothetical protein
MNETMILDRILEIGKARVVFRRDSKGTIVALFPQIPVNENVDDCLAYNSVKQFYPANYGDSVFHSKMASPKEYSPLFGELSSMGIDITVTQRAKADVHNVRAEAIGEGKIATIAEEAVAGAKGGNSVAAPAAPPKRGVKAAPKVVAKAKQPIDVEIIPVVMLKWNCEVCTSGIPVLSGGDMVISCPLCGTNYKVTPLEPYVQRLEQEGS